MKKTRVRVKKWHKKMELKTPLLARIELLCWFILVSIIVSFMIAGCPSQVFVWDKTGQEPRRESEMQVTIFAGHGSYQHHAMESLTLRHENGAEYPINAKDVEEKMLVLLGGKFRYVVSVKV